MKILVASWRAKEPLLPGAVLTEVEGLDYPVWEIEIRDLEHLIELSQNATIAFTRFRLYPSKKEKAQGAPVLGPVSMIVDDVGMHFQKK